MEDYNSKYEGAEVDALLDKAGKAVQPEDLAAVATSGSYNDLSNKPTIPDISGKVDKVSGKGLSTNDYTTTEKNKLAGIASGAEVNVQSDWNVTNSSSDAYIKNKPTIPAAVTENTVIGWGFTKNTGTYSKPSTGIPKSDLASAVQTSLGKADTALQSYTEQYKGTVTGVKINGSTKNPQNGVVDLGTVLTAHQDISGKQDKLVSGTNIKTVNGQSILGSGDIEISGGGDSLYFTEFTVEAFVGAMGSSIQLENKAALVQAIKDNKIICVPFANPAQGYMVASARLEKNDYEDVVYSVYLYLIYNNGLHVRYIPYYVDSLQFVSLSTFSNVIVSLDTPSVDGDIACTYLVNSVVEDSLDVNCQVQTGETMRVVFMTGNTTPTIYIYAGDLCWANGVIPEIEPNTIYELSLCPVGGFCNVVLTAFKPE